jgi:hypothetical protein
MGYKHGYATIIVNVCDFATIHKTLISRLLQASFIVNVCDFATIRETPISGIL